MSLKIIDSLQEDKKNDTLPPVLLVVGRTWYDGFIENLKTCYDCSPIDFLELHLENEKKLIGIEQVKFFCQQLNNSSYQKNKLAVIFDAHLLTEAAANRLLKTLEELSSTSYIVLIAQTDNLLPTIKSRINRTEYLDEQLETSKEADDFVKNNLLQNLEWIERNHQKIDIENFLVNLIQAVPSEQYFFKEKILVCLEKLKNNVSGRLLLEYLAIVGAA